MRNNKRTFFTRMCITEAVLDLMLQMPYEKITVSAVIKKAGIARMTFYNHYSSIQDALADYLQILIHQFLEKCKAEQGLDKLFTYDNVLMVLNYFDQYQSYFSLMCKYELHGLMMKGMNQALDLYFPLDIFPNAESPHLRFSIYCYAGGLFNAFLQWQENPKKEDATEIASYIMQGFPSVLSLYSF